MDEIPFACKKLKRATFSLRALTLAYWEVGAVSYLSWKCPFAPSGLRLAPCGRWGFYQSLVYHLICLPRMSCSKQAVKRKDAVLSFFLFSLILALDNTFLSGVSRVFGTAFLRLCAFCVPLTIDSENKKSLVSFGTQDFQGWSEWRDLNPRPLGPEYLSEVSTDNFVSM